MRVCRGKPSVRPSINSAREQRRGVDIPSLDLLERLELGNGDEDDDGLLSTLDINFSGGGDLERSEVGLEVGNVVLEVEESLGDGQFNVIGGGRGSVSRSQDLADSRRHAIDYTEIRGKVSFASRRRSEPEVDDGLVVFPLMRSAALQI